VPERAGFGEGGGRGPDAARAAGQFIRVALERFAHEMPPVFDAIGSLYAERTADILDLWDEGERTFIHGDPHGGNLFDDGGRTGFYDWAMCSRSPGMRDVAYYLCNSVPSDTRHEIEGEMLDLYRHTLAARDIHIDPALTAKQYRLFAVYSWVSATSTAAVGSRWQPSDRALAAMERTTRAVEDCDSVGLLQELLS
jgi:Ser/Thr protein kinase RdoA (MazF antagonist)